MDDFFKNRSQRLVVGVVGILLVGIFFAYALPTTKFTDSSYGTTETESFGLSEISARVQLFGKGWTYDVARVGILLALVMALVLQTRQQAFQRFSILVGCAMGLIFPIYLHSLLESGDSLGSGMILYSIAVIAAAILPWIPGVYPAESESSPAQVTEAFSLGPRERADRPIQTAVLKLYPTSGTPGTIVDATADGFPSNSFVTFKWLHESDEPLTLGVREASLTGSVHLRFTVTPEAGEGSYRLSASNGVQTTTTGFFVKDGVGVMTNMSE